MNRSTLSTLALIGFLGLGTAACAGDDDRPGSDDQADMPMGESMDGMGGMDGMHDMDGMSGSEGMGAMMRRHAVDADSMVDAMRPHVEEMSQQAPAQWHARMGEHVGMVSRMLTLMSSQMDEMDMGMDLSDERMGEMMGMSGAEHREMLNEMRALRTDLEQLQVASREEVAARMPDHLERLDRVLEMMDDAADHMESVTGS